MSNWYKIASLGDILPFIDFIKKMTDWQFNPEREDFEKLNINEEQLIKLTDFIVSRMNTLEDKSLEYLNTLSVFAFRIQVAKKMGQIPVNTKIRNKIVQLVYKKIEGVPEEEKCNAYLAEIEQVLPKLESGLRNQIEVHHIDWSGKMPSYQKCKRELEQGRQETADLAGPITETNIV